MSASSQPIRRFRHEITDHGEALLVSVIETHYAHADALHRRMVEGWRFDTADAMAAATASTAALTAYIVALESRCTTATLEELQCPTP